MAIILSLAKFYIVILLFRFVSNRQELMFNPVGKMVAMATDPILPKNSGSVIPLYIMIIVLVTSALGALSIGNGFVAYNFLINIRDYLLFFVLFFTVSMILGSFGHSAVAGGFVAFFFRLGLPWVKLARVFFPVKSGKIVIPATIILFLLYICITFLMYIVYNVITTKSIGNVLYCLLIPFTQGIHGFLYLLLLLTFVIIARALISWVSPDPRNPIVQLIFIITEPILEPARKIIPPIGFLDLSALVVIIVLQFFYQILSNIIPRLG